MLRNTINESKMEVKKKIIARRIHKEPREPRGMKYTVYEFTFFHSDLVPAITDYQCSLCGARDFASLESAKQHVFLRHWWKINPKHKVRDVDYMPHLISEMRGGETHYSCKYCGQYVGKEPAQSKTHLFYKHGTRIFNLSKAFTETYVKKVTKQLYNFTDVDVSLEKYLIWCQKPNGGVVELLVDSVDDYEDIISIPSWNELKKHINFSRESLTQTMEEFETRVQGIYDEYLGTPKEKIDIAPIDDG